MTAKKIDIEEWLNQGKHLPEFMRDFHYQKELFKAMHEIVIEDKSKLEKRPTWIQGHIYVIDVFLWFMARRGYTLQRSRSKMTFRDLTKDIENATKKREDSFAEILKNAVKDHQ